MKCENGFVIRDEEDIRYQFDLRGFTFGYCWYYSGGSMVYNFKTHRAN